MPEAGSGARLGTSSETEPAAEETVDLAVEQVVPVPVNRPLEFHLTWRSPPASTGPVDMDIGCFYWIRDGKRGAVQLVGPPETDDDTSAATGDPGADNAAGSSVAHLTNGDRFIVISEDQVDGGSGGERLTVDKPNELSFLVLHVSIYSGAADFRSTGASIEVTAGGEHLAAINLNSRTPGLYWCAVLVLGAKGRKLFMAHEERYFQSAYHADRHYGLGAHWGLGKKR